MADDPQGCRCSNDDAPLAPSAAFSPRPPADAFLHRDSSPDTTSDDSDSKSGAMDLGEEGAEGEPDGADTQPTDSLALNEVELQSFKNGVKLFGLGRWAKMNAVGLLPGRGTADYVEICQRHLKQQSLSTVAGLHLDMDRLREHNLSLIRELQENPAKCQEFGMIARNGVLVNVSGQLTAEERTARIAAHQARFGLPPEEVQRLSRDEAFLDETFRAKQLGLWAREKDLRATQRFHRRSSSNTPWQDPLLEQRFAEWCAMPTPALCSLLATKQAELATAWQEYLQFLAAHKRRKRG
eukprot:GGOE01037217.1.p1 GENE.GGOE01037217.1~~GGOE01037217.1.p1  ORF type:complete len:320 (+),score=92.49 GGOE01037217.1:73-960(+)